jgi:hypothetical protein
MKNVVKLLCTHPGPPGLADVEPDSPKIGWTKAYLFFLQRDPPLSQCICSFISQALGMAFNLP